jgi:hypothetical protein
LLEAVVIELPHERDEVGGLEVEWEHRVGEDVLVIDDDGIAFFPPANDAVAVRALLSVILRGWRAACARISAFY